MHYTLFVETYIDHLAELLVEANTMRRELGIEGAMEMLRRPGPLKSIPKETPGECKSIPLCPKCKTPMIKKTNRTTNEQFWGCPTFPECRGTRRLDGSAGHRIARRRSYGPGPDAESQEAAYEREADMFEQPF